MKSGSITLRRIRAVKEFGFIKAGDVGGWIESEKNLSHDDDAWVGGNARVNGNAWVNENAQVEGNAWVGGNAWIGGNARVKGNALLKGYVLVERNAIVDENALVEGSALVGGNAWIGGNARVKGNALVGGKAWVGGNAWVDENAKIFSINHILIIGPAGSRNDFTTFYMDKDNEITVKCGCFLGKTDEFLKKVTETHGDNKHAFVYREAVKIAKLQIELCDEK